jgi:hypothetical protein
MNKIDALKNELREIVKKAPDLPPEIKQYAVYVKSQGQKIYLNAYIPFIGEKYGQVTRVLFYCTAQALSKRNTKYLEEYTNDTDKAIDRLRLRKADTLDIDVGPVGGGVLPALAGLLLYAKDKLWLEYLPDILQRISVTNFYKYSLWNSKKNDLNPDDLEDKSKMLYDDFIFDNFIKQEISILKPDYIFICGKRGTHRFDLVAHWLKQQELAVKPHLINDPASLLHGGKVRETPLKDEKVEELIGIYCSYIREKSRAKDPHFYTQYGGRINQIKNYLRFYYQAIL